AHFEDAEIKVHPGCVGCLLQLGSSTVLKPPPAPMVPLSRDARGVVPANPASSARLGLPPSLLSLRSRPAPRGFGPFELDFHPSGANGAGDASRRGHHDDRFAGPWRAPLDSER